LAAFDGAKMVGVTGFWVRTRFWCGRQFDVDNFYIRADYRNLGLGTRLMAWLEKQALAEDCALMVLDVYADNNLAQRFYHRMGFVITGYHFTKVPGTNTPYIPKNRKQA
jgi:ribosomal protein S18 acetylase RimI-like enzyme